MSEPNTPSTPSNPLFSIRVLNIPEQTLTYLHPTLDRIGDAVGNLGAATTVVDKLAHTVMLSLEIRKLANEAYTLGCLDGTRRSNN